MELNYSIIALYIYIIEKFEISNKDSLLKLEFFINRELMKKHGIDISRFSTTKSKFCVYDGYIISEFTRDFILNNKITNFIEVNGNVMLSHSSLTTLIEKDITLADELSITDIKMIDYVVSKLQFFRKTDMKNYIFDNNIEYDFRNFFKEPKKEDIFQNSVSNELKLLNEESYLGLL